jgi:hypothetical protein
MSTEQDLPGQTVTGTRLGGRVVSELLHAVRADGALPDGLLAEGFRCFTPLHDWLDGDEAAKALAEVLRSCATSPSDDAQPNLVAGDDAAVVELFLAPGEPERGLTAASPSPCTVAFVLAGNRVAEARCYFDPAGVSFGGHRSTAPGRSASGRTEK